MANPVGTDIYVSYPLSNVSIAYQQTANFVADKVFPVVPVVRQGGLFYTFGIGEFTRNQMQLRGPGTESAGSGWSLSNASYYCDVWALHKDIAKQDRANAAGIFDIDSITTNWLTRQGLLAREYSFATNFMKTGVWGTDITGVASSPSASQVLQWSDTASTPIENIRRAMTAVQEATGVRPNILTLGRKTWDALVDHPDIIDRIKGGATVAIPAKVQLALLAQLLELDEVMVMDAVINTANEGATTQTSAFVNGKSALLSYAPSAPSLLEPAAGYTFAWTGYLGGTSPIEVSRFPMVELKSDRIEIETAYGQKQTGSQLGYFWASIVA